MNKLIFAGFARLRKDLAFWICFFGMMALGIYLPVNNYLESIRYDFKFSADLMLNYSPLVCFVAAVFISLFLGVDYSDGTIRNKMMVGRTRNEIYMANWVVCMTAMLLCMLAFAVPCLALSLCFKGVFINPPMAYVWAALLSLLAAAGISSVYVMVSMLCQNKAVSAVICLVIAIVLFFAAIIITSALEEPPTYEGMVMFVDGELVRDEGSPNPFYITGFKRAVYEFLNDFLPMNQAVQCAEASFENPLRLSLCALVITLWSTLGGLALFSRKDLK